MRSGVKRLFRRSGGIVLIEAAILFPLAMGIVFGVGYYANLYAIKFKLGESARVIARAIQDDPDISQGMVGPEAGDLDQVVWAATNVKDVPDGFNPAAYRQCNGDLGLASDDQARDHFSRFGRYEPRSGTSGSTCGTRNTVASNEVRVSIQAFASRPTDADLASQFQSHPSGRQQGNQYGWSYRNPNSDPTKPFWISVVAQKPSSPRSLFGFTFGTRPEISNYAVVRVMPKVECSPAGTLCGAGFLENSSHGVLIRANESGVRTCKGTTLIDSRSQAALLQTRNASGIANASTTTSVVNCPTGYHGVLVGYSIESSAQYFQYACSSDGLGCPTPCTENPTPTLGPCSVTCGGGTQTVTFTNSCGQSRWGGSQSCNTQPCCIENPTPTLGPCSASCGGGTQTVTFTNSCGQSRPGGSQSCNTQACPPPPQPYECRKPGGWSKSCPIWGYGGQGNQGDCANVTADRGRYCGGSLISNGVRIGVDCSGGGITFYEIGTCYR